MTARMVRATWSDYLFVVPALLFVVIILLLPVLFPIGTSLADWDLLHPMRFVGLANNAQLVRNPYCSSRRATRSCGSRAS